MMGGLIKRSTQKHTMLTLALWAVFVALAIVFVALRWPDHSEYDFLPMSG